jgi:hypothetical protein
MPTDTRTKNLLLLGLALLATAALYVPGLSGGYVFDDFPNIIDNTAIHVTKSSYSAWINAALSSPASALHRPLASLTFAANWLFTGSAPGPMKITNLMIHLLNGALLYGMLMELMRLYAINRKDRGGVDETRTHWLAFAVTTAWLMLPINLQAVLYVVQRMESLCQLFVLAGLWGYLRERRRMLAAESIKQETVACIRAAAYLGLGTVLGLTAKESSVLLPLYAFLADLILFGLRRPDDKPQRSLWLLYTLMLFVPAVLGLIWLMPHVLPAQAWANRTFTLGTRLLTEPLVLMEYLRWILLPTLGTLSLYHDEIKASTGLLQPPVTLAGFVVMFALLALAIWQRRERPLLALGIVWYYAAHLLTATIIPLELVYEHRNYFAAIGVLLAVFSLLLGTAREAVSPFLRGSLIVLLIAWFAGLTLLRAQEWSDPLRLAMTEADRRDQSPRANYEAARLLIVASNYQASPALDKAWHYLRRSAAISGSSTLPEQAMLMVVDHDAQGDDEAAWQSMLTKLRSQPVSEEDISGLISLTRCRVQTSCVFDPAKLQEAFQAALSQPAPTARLLAAYSLFARELLGDDQLTEEYLRRAIDKAPGEAVYRMDIARIYAAQGRLEQVVKQIDALRRLNKYGQLDAQIASLEQLAEHGAKTP